MASGIIDLGSSGKMSGRITWSSSSNGPQNNNSNVTATLQVRRNDSYGPTTGTFTGSLFIHDEQQDYSVHARVSSDWVTLKSFSKTVGHSGDGKGSCHIWGNISGPSGTSMSGSYVEADTWVTLDTIPRYASFTEHWIGATGLNSVTVHWATDVPCDRVQYSLNDGGWTDTASTNYTVGGLAPSTPYTIKSRTRRTDSQLWNEGSGTLTFTTKAISAVQSWTQLTLPAPGNTATINYKMSNPSGNNTYVYLERNNAGDNYGCNSGSTSVTSGDKTLTLSSAALNQIYNEHASVTASYNGDVNKRATSGMQLTARTSGLTNYYNSYGVTFIMTKANCGPTAIKDFTCQEQQADVAALTGCSTSKTYTNGNGLIVLKGYSNVKISVAANPLSVRAGASNRAISINGGEWLTSTSATSKTLAGVTTNNFSITAKDSREFSLSKSSTGVTLKTYTPVNISSLRIDRGDGVSTTAYLTLAGTYNALNFGAVTNSISSVKLQIKTKNVAWTATKITGATTGVIDTTKVNEYTITSLLTASSGKIACSAKELKVSGTSGNSLQFVLGTEYDARIIITDQLTAKSSFSSQVVTKNTSITSGKVLFSAVKNGGVCFGGFYTGETAALQIANNSYFLVNTNAGIQATIDGGCGIRSGGDGASSTTTNMQLFSWYGIGFGPSISGQTIPLNENAVFINCRTGELTTRGNVRTIGSSGDVRYWATRSDTGVSIWYGVGSGGTNRGLYDVGLNKWLIHSDGNKVYLNGYSTNILMKAEGYNANIFTASIPQETTVREYIKETSNRPENLAQWGSVITVPAMQYGYSHQIAIGNFSSKSRMAIRTHVLGQTPTGWEYLASCPTVLYSNDSGTSGSFTLSDSAGNYSRLEIYFRDQEGQHSGIVVYNPNGKRVNLDMTVTNSGINGAWAKIKAITISGTSIHVDWYCESSITDSMVQRNNFIFITKVIGFLN